MLRDDIKTALNEAMKAKAPKVRISTLRLMNAAIQDRDIALRAADQCGGVGDEEVLAVLAKMVRQREESSKQYDEGGRPELAEQERAEIEVIREFMPRQLSEAEIEQAVKTVIDELDAEGLKDMGRCMGALKERYSGAMDFGRAGKVMKSELG